MLVEQDNCKDRGGGDSSCSNVRNRDGKNVDAWLRLQLMLTRGWVLVADGTPGSTRPPSPLPTQGLQADRYEKKKKLLASKRCPGRLRCGCD